MDPDLFLDIQFTSISTGAIIALVSVVLLLCFSGLVSASEIAFFSLTPTDKNDIGEKKTSVDTILSALLLRSGKLSATLLFWNNLVNIGIIVLTAYAVYRFISFSNAPLFGFILEVILLTFLILLFGEIIPKICAQNKPLLFSRKIAPFLSGMEKITRPFSFLLVNFTHPGGTAMKKKNSDVSVDELSKALELTSKELPEEKDMLEGIISLYNKTAVEIMTSRLDVADLDITTGFKKVISYILEVSYSRIPVYSGNQDDIRGILYIKDLLPYLNQPDHFCWQKMIRPAFFVPETKKIDDLLEEFRTSKIHLAVVVDEFGGTSGIVTMEDILEEIVGEINDEYDEDDTKVTRLADGSVIFDAKILLTDFFRATTIDAKTFGKLTGEVDTLAGLVLEIKGDFPENKEIIQYKNYSFQVLEMDKKRISKIKFSQK
ncbi:MAG: gliding motility-associated protein GldE [Candidatus Symbiothrix sp.]|nr:gliding motility-associated protein GldE [Candidatus Symbiothrix sp.]